MPNPAPAMLKTIRSKLAALWAKLRRPKKAIQPNEEAIQCAACRGRLIFRTLESDGPDVAMSMLQAMILAKHVESVKLPPPPR